MDEFGKFMVAILSALYDAFRAHQEKDEEARHQAVLKINRLTSDEIAKKVLKEGAQP